MTFSWRYPLYLLPHHQGYASLVKSNKNESIQSLIVCTGGQAAVELMSKFALLGTPRALRNAREFRWLLESLKEPVSEVVFDPVPTDNALNARWQVTVAELLKQYLPGDHSPWNYPVFAIGQASGFACIEGARNDAWALKAIAIFSTEEKAVAYLRHADEQGDVLELPDLEAAVTFLAALQADIPAVALDPRVVDGRRVAEFCLTMEVLLAKYLVPPD